MKQIYIINGSGTSGKDTFVEKISKLIIERLEKNGKF